MKNLTLQKHEGIKQELFCYHNTYQLFSLLLENNTSFFYPFLPVSILAGIFGRQAEEGSPGKLSEAAEWSSRERQCSGDGLEDFTHSDSLFSVLNTQKAANPHPATLQNCLCKSKWITFAAVISVEGEEYNVTHKIQLLKSHSAKMVGVVCSI